MINEKEKQAVTLSPTKKDFYQIWNELLDTASKLSERWDPASTNESDPGIVLLKVLTAIADKLNYNIDKNTLEAFMPSAAQEESMRKLCDMLGYNMKYYRSATTNVNISYTGNESLNTVIVIDCFTNIKNADDDVNYVTTEARVLGEPITSVTVPCIEGELVECETDNDNIISTMLLDDNYKYYLPETQIAENGIFITNISEGMESEFWNKVQNLNTVPLQSKVFKFGFDSAKGVPYIQFPSDISTIIEDGVRIRYIRTHGINGNVSARTLTQLEKPASWEEQTDSNNSSDETTTDFYDVANYIVINNSAATNGCNPETLKQAYNNYKKTIGTFDTLVTCRDYMNKIYQLTENDVDTTPLVSNIIVSDIRDDINKAVTICSFNDYGICYVDTPLPVSSTKKALTHFDLLLYPFTIYKNLGTADDFKSSFIYNPKALNEIITNDDIKACKTISHNMREPEDREITCIKNYLKLNAKITTTRRVNVVEEKDILQTIYKAIYNTFNLRELDFGEEIPFDDILACIENADERIKNISLAEPILYTKVQYIEGSDIVEKDFALDISQVGSDSNNAFYQMAIKNILAGKLPLFDYDDSFTYDFREKNVEIYGKGGSYIPPSPYTSTTIIKLKPAFCPTLEAGKTKYDKIELGANEIVQFRAPNFKTVLTYPAYVNYFLHLVDSNSSLNTSAIPATFKELYDFLRTENPDDPASNKAYYNNLFKYATTYNKVIEIIPVNETAYNTIKAANNILCTCSGSASNYTFTESLSYTANTKYYYLPLEANTFGVWTNWVKSLNRTGLFASKGSSADYTPGYLVDAGLTRYIERSTYNAGTTYYIPVTHTADSDDYTIDGLGRDAIISAITGEYQLKNGEYLCINYTTTSKDDNGNETKSKVNKAYTEGTIIRPSFELIDSLVKHTSGISWAKTKDFGPFEGIPTADVPGMFSLGADEQIEIREPVIVKLNEPYTNIYWQLNDENLITSINNEISFFEDGALSRVLAEGEYFYYTDSNKAEIAFYGSGTEITRSGVGVKITKRISDSEITPEMINEQGFSVIPWKTYNFTTDQYLTITEYQYITLSDTDTITNLDLNGESLTNAWKIVANQDTDPVQYYSNGAAQTLPAIKVEIAGQQAKWEVHSKLAINIGPNTTQYLGSDDYITLCFDDDHEEIISNTSTSSCIKANYNCISDNDIVNVSITKYLDADLSETEEINDFQIKSFELDNTLNKNKFINFNNFSSSLTKLIFDDYLDAGSPVVANDKVNLQFNINIPKTAKEALIMLYATNGDKDTLTKNISLTFKENDVNKPLVIYNYYLNNQNAWWDGQKDETTNTYYVYPHQISIIKLPIDNSANRSYVLTVSAPIDSTTNTTDNTAILSNVDLILGPNPHIGLGETQGLDSNVFEELLKKINIADAEHTFYYNNKTSASMQIDFNANLINGNSETLLDPYIWYDYNNLGNKFVISEIDADSLKAGITLTKSSKL